MMCYLRLLYSVLIVILPILECSAGLKTIYFSDICAFSWSSYTRTIHLGSTLRDYNSSAILKAKNFGFYPTEISCTVIIQPPPGYGVVASVRSIDLRPSCVDNLTLTDSLTFNRTFCGKKSYSHEKMSVHSPSSLTVIFKTGSSSEGSNAFHDGFKLTVTAYKNWPCSNFEFECSNLRCIANELTCDGHNHCGDKSDQSRCGVKSISDITGTIFGCIFISVAILAGIVYYRKKYVNRTATRTYLNPLPPQPLYPGYGTTYSPQAICHPPPQEAYPPPPQEAYPPPPKEAYPPPPYGAYTSPPQGVYPPAPQGAYPFPSGLHTPQPQGPTAPPTQH